MNTLFALNEAEITEQKNHKLRGKRFIGDAITILLLILCAFLVFAKFFWFFCVEVEGDSMNDTLKSGDYLLVDKLAKPERGDVIVFTLNEKAYIKRVVATEGDTVRFWDGKLYVKRVDGKYFEEIDYAGVIGKTYYNNDPNGFWEWVVHSGNVYVLGDNRENSTDSRVFGEISLDLVEGVVHQFIIDNKDETLGKFYKYL